MSGQYIKEFTNTPEIVDETEVDTNNLAVNSDPSAGPIPEDAALIHETPMSEKSTREALVVENDESPVALLNPEDSARFRKIWNEVQGRFVDDPRSAVEQADALVSEVIEQLTQMFAHEHNTLEGRWNQGNDVSTENLRQALLRYHSFFNRLVV